MPKARALFTILLLGCWAMAALPSAPVYAQEAEDPGLEEPDYHEPEDGGGNAPIESDWEGYSPDLYARGDQIFTISVGVIFPAVFFNNGTVVDHHVSPPVGGAGSLAYNHFLGAHFNLGGEIGVKFFYTLGQNAAFIIPIGLRIGYQLIFKRFEFPLSISIGFAPQRYLNFGYMGLYMKGGASAFYRFNPDWSFGLNIDWNWYPQWPLQGGKPIPAKNMDGNIIGLTLSARYHF